jgi:hypothetical protein
MRRPETPPIEVLTENTVLTRTFYLFLLAPTLLGAAHHLDHVLRGNHVGWPLTPEVNAFTYSLAVYPLLALGLFLTVTERAGVRYWIAFFAASTALLASVHLGPWAIEPPTNVIGPYADPAVGYLAFAIVLALIGSVAVGTGYAAALWYRGDA